MKCTNHRPERTPSPQIDMATTHLPWEEPSREILGVPQKGLLWPSEDKTLFPICYQDYHPSPRKKFLVIHQVILSRVYQL